MGYATVMDVQGRNVARGTYGASTRPTADQVVEYIEMTAAELDSILRSKGFSLPIASEATQALALMEHYNALGAACLVESSAENDARAAGVCSMYESAKAALEAGNIDLDLPDDPDEGLRFSTAEPIFAIPSGLRDGAVADRAPSPSTRDEGNFRDY